MPQRTSCRPARCRGDALGNDGLAAVVEKLKMVWEEIRILRSRQATTALIGRGQLIEQI